MRPHHHHGVDDDEGMALQQHKEQPRSVPALDPSRSGGASQAASSSSAAAAAPSRSSRRGVPGSILKQATGNGGASGTHHPAAAAPAPAGTTRHLIHPGKEGGSALPDRQQQQQQPRSVTFAVDLQPDEPRVASLGSPQPPRLARQQQAAPQSSAPPRSAAAWAAKQGRNPAAAAAAGVGGSSTPGGTTSTSTGSSIPLSTGGDAGSPADDAAGGDGGGRLLRPDELLMEGSSSPVENLSPTSRGAVAAAAALWEPSTYATNPVTLTFVDKEVEQRYVNFQSTYHGFLAGKLYTLLAGVINVGLLFPYLNFTFEGERWSQTSVVVLYAGTFIGWLGCGLVFLDVAIQFREVIFFVAVATHWPAFALSTIVAKEDQAFRYAYTTLCLEFCCFIAQPRFVGMFFFLTGTPIATLFIATSAIEASYWDSHSRFEMMYWLMPLFPLWLLRVFEQHNRAAFVENLRSQLFLGRLRHREEVTRRIITRFFPVSISRRMLQSHGRDPTAKFDDAALISASVHNFTEWAALMSSEDVVARIAATFVTLERLARYYDVEKVTTLGDKYLGASFAPMATPTTSSVNTSTSGGNRTTSGSATTPSASDGSSRALNITNSTSTDTHQARQQQQLLPAPQVIETPPQNAQQQQQQSADGAADPVKESPASPRSVGDDDQSESGLLPCVGPLSAVVPATAAATAHDMRVARRCHQMLRFATAVRFHRDTLPLRIGLHVGTVIGGFVGIQPPKFDLFGAPVERVRQLEAHGRKQRLHASNAIIAAARPLGYPSADFEASDSDGQIFSSWRAIRATTQDLSASSPRRLATTTTTTRSATDAMVDGEPGSHHKFIATPVSNPLSSTTAAAVVSPSATPEEVTATTDLARPGSTTVSTTTTAHGAGAAHDDDDDDDGQQGLDAETQLEDELHVQAHALQLCRYLTRFGEEQRLKAMEGFETRNDLLRRSLADAVARGAVGNLQRPLPLDGDSSSVLISQPQSLSGGGGDTEHRSFSGDDLDDGGNFRRFPPSSLRPLGGDTDRRFEGSGGGEDGLEMQDRSGDPQRRALLSLSTSSGGAALDDDGVFIIDKPGDEEKLYTFSVVRMRFDDPRVEAQYVEHIRGSDLGQRVGFVFAVMSIYIMGAAVLNTCVESASDRLATGVAICANMVNVSYLYFIGTSHKYHVLVTVLLYSAPAWAAAMLLLPDCSDRDYDAAVRAVGNAIAMYFIQPAAAAPLQMDVWMWARFGFTVFNAAQWAGATLIRRVLVRDEVLFWEALAPSIVISMSFISTFTDLAMRSGFQATMRRRALESNRSAHAQQAMEALEMMLPVFVVERLLRTRSTVSMAGGRDDDTDGLSSIGSGSVGSRATALSRGSLLSSNSTSSASVSGSSSRRRGRGRHRRSLTGLAAQALLVQQHRETVWPYHRAVVMFVSFDTPVVAYPVISDTVMRIEAVARGRSIQKVKTVGTTALLVAGIDNALLFEDAVVNALEAALEIERRVFPSNLADGWGYRIGIHVGPVFGAVIGSCGLAFDIYGDTVATTQHVMATAPANTLRCTAAVRRALPDVQLDTVKLMPVGMPLKIRGKRDVDVFQVHERHQPIRLAPDPSPIGIDDSSSRSNSVVSNSPAWTGANRNNKMPAAAVRAKVYGRNQAAALPPVAVHDRLPAVTASSAAHHPPRPQQHMGNSSRRALDEPSSSSSSTSKDRHSAPTAAPNAAFVMDNDIDGFSSNDDDDQDDRIE